MNALGLIAGGGDLPRAAAFAARQAGRDVFVVPLMGSATEDWIAEFPHEWLSPGEPGRIIKAMKAHGVAEVLMCGRVDRPKFTELKLDAKGMLQNQQGAKVIVSGCANGSTPPPPNDPPPPPPAPKLGPTVAFNKVLGGLEAHITDRSGVSSQCTYATDNINRSFALPANSTYDLRIVPAIPQFRNWNVTVACDNGTSTTASTYF